MKVTVVGGGLAGLAAALDLVDAGHDVTVLEARPTLGGAVQTLPEREGDPEPAPDNGQHIALGCFTEYLRFLDRIGEGGSFLRTRLALPVIAEDGTVAAIEPRLASLLRYRHLPVRDRLRIPSSRRVAGRRAPSPGRRSARCCGASARPTRRSTASGTSSSGPRSTSAATRWTPRRGSSPSERRCSGRERTATSSSRPGRSAGCTAMRRDRRSRWRARRSTPTNASSRSTSSTPTRSSSRCRRARARACSASRSRRSRTRRSSASTSGSTGRCSTTPLAALLGSDAHWVFDRGALTGHAPERGQYLTVVSSGVPELLEVRGRELVERIAGQLTDRLGEAELLWSRVSREPYATIALRPGTVRPGVETSRPGVVRAGTWTDTGWPATMESAVRSGRRAAQHILSSLSARVTA